METDQTTLIHSLLHHLSAVFNRECDQLLQEQFGIGFAQFKILDALSKNPATQQKHLAITLGQTEASISRQIKLLQQRDFIDTRVNPENHREHHTVLTYKDQRLTEAAQQILGSFYMASLQHMPVKQQTQLLELLSQVHR